MAHKVIVDTDTGIDDAMGCVLALKRPELEVLGFTSVFGNVDVELTTRNTAVLLEQTGHSDVPLARGAARGFVGIPSFNPEIHGHDGVGNADFPTPTKRAELPISAAEFIIRSARENPGEVTFIALGPLTNLALALMLDPTLPTYLPRVVWMGGAVYEPGNVTPVGEADACHDPEGAQMVLEQASWEVMVVSLDVTDSTLFRAVDLERLNRSSSPAARYLQRIVPFYMDFYSPLLGERACAMHSALTVGLVARPELIRGVEKLPISIELNGYLTRGMTVADRRPGRKVSANRAWMVAPEATLVRDVNRSAFVELFLESVDA
ncbi:nucleoside hydrolase [Ensifer sp. ENS06]|uniref:nucleoside hydrolase n=1 Tax=Ensifer sp. ENS06 TaxID=2769276 RepID=UPI001783FCEA|nr:nucleoside hydrolase [Ensifer sp. ENS06]MBD9627089.1 nucleoside hydrolase [Ensifer sp. ENS06]